MSGRFLRVKIRPGWVGKPHASAWRCAYCGTEDGEHWFCGCGCHHSGLCGGHEQAGCGRPELVWPRADNNYSVKLDQDSE